MSQSISKTKEENRVPVAQVCASELLSNGSNALPPIDEIMEAAETNFKFLQTVPYFKFH
jgi:hypothetical protein